MKNNYLYASISKRRVIDDEYITNVLINSEIYLNGIYSNGVEYYVDGSGNITTDITDYRLGVGNPDGTLFLTMQDLSEPFVATMITTSSYEEVILPLVSGYDYDFTIDWGDGSPLQNVTYWDSPNRSHNYTTGPQLYTVTIRGSMPTWRYGFSWNSNGTPHHLQEIVSMGDVGFGENISQFDYMFSGCVNLTSIPQLNTSNGQDFGGMFSECSSLTTIPQLNTSNGQNFSSMFYGCINLTTIPELDTSSGQNFNDMFRNCSSLTTIPLIDTSNGQNFGSMFGECSSLTTIPQLVTSSGQNFSNMFMKCSSLTTIPQLNTSNGQYFSGMFGYCPLLTSVPLIDTSNGLGFSGMFRNCSSLTTIPLIDTSNGQYVNGMFHGCSSLTTIPLIVTSNSKSFYSMFYGCSSLTTIPQLDTSNGLEFNYMFQDCSSLEIASLNGTRNNIDYSSCSLSDLNERNNIYTNLADLIYLGLPSATITMPTSIGEDDSIATLKGWSVYRAP